MATYLSEILATHRAAAEADRRDLDDLLELAVAAPDATPFAAALSTADADGLAVVAEVKRRSPSAGELVADLDPAAVARAYAAGGARCLSVLTDGAYFGGSVDDLVVARAATGLPTLRKDFTVGPADVCDARLMGADAVLLIVAALSQAELVEYVGLAARLAFDALVEVHDEGELERAVSAGATLVGVNQRDLSTFAVDPERAARVGALIPAGIVSVAESGIRTADDARRLAAAGFDAVLVGEGVVRAGDRAGAVAALAGHPVGHRAPR